VPYDFITYRHDTLYAKVWADPVEIVAIRYGVSGVACEDVQGARSPPSGPRLLGKEAIRAEAQEDPLPAPRKDTQEEVRVIAGEAASGATP
jgi:hypothetical protein